MSNTNNQNPPLAAPTGSGYVRHYKASHHKEEATTSLAWKDGVLMQKWKISETRDIYCDEAKRDYSHTDYHREEVWRLVPTIPNETSPSTGATE